MRQILLGLTCHLFTILVWAASSFANGAQATIKRDHYGVPHVYSDTLEGLFLGMDMLFRKTASIKSKSSGAPIGEDSLKFMERDSLLLTRLIDAII